MPITPGPGLDTAALETEIENALAWVETASTLNSNPATIRQGLAQRLATAFENYMHTAKIETNVSTNTTGVVAAGIALTGASPAGPVTGATSAPGSSSGTGTGDGVGRII